MLDAIIQLSLFTAKTLIIFVLIFAVLVLFFSLLERSKEKLKGRLQIKNLNKKHDENKELMLHEILHPKAFKKYAKEKAQHEKAEKKNENEDKQNVYVLNFHGDIKASAVGALSEEITAILNVARPQDEVIVRLESGGGVVHGYGLAAAQLMRLRAKNIFLTITIDKVAASGGYMMAAVANKILAAPFAIIGSIGVIVQLPNFNRKLKDNHIDFEMITAGEYKRTITVFGENTEEGRHKLKQEIEHVHQLFKNLISEYRKDLNIDQVATGEHWLGQQALDLKLVDELKTSDDYLLEKSHAANLYELSYETKKTFMSKFSGAVSLIKDKFKPQTLLQ